MNPNKQMNGINAMSGYSMNTYVREEITPKVIATISTDYVNVKLLQNLNQDE